MDSSPGCEDLIKEVSLKEELRHMSSGLIGLHLKGILMDELFTMSWNWLALKGMVPPGSARPQMSKYQNTENKTHG